MLQPVSPRQKSLTQYFWKEPMEWRRLVHRLDCEWPAWPARAAAVRRTSEASELANRDGIAKGFLVGMVGVDDSWQLAVWRFGIWVF